VGLSGTVSIGDMPLFRELTFLAPGREMRTLLDSSESYFLSGQPTRIAAKVTHTDAAGRRHTSIMHHNLEVYRRIGYVTGPASPEEGR
jgi:hypothetical protein